jgi:hypothetical protein
MALNSALYPVTTKGTGIGKVIKDGHEVVARGVADTEPAACEQANEAARKAFAPDAPNS